MKDLMLQELKDDVQKGGLENIGVENFPEGLNSLFVEAVENYSISKKLGDSNRTQQYKDDAFQLLCVGNNIMHFRLERSKKINTWSGKHDWQLKRSGFSNDTRIQNFLADHKLPTDKVMDIEEPVLLKNWKEDIPGEIYNKIKKVNELFDDEQVKFFVADVKNDPDPILFFQFKKNERYTFCIGAWE